MHTPDGVLHLPLKKRLVRLVATLIIAAGMFGGGAALAGSFGITWWVGLLGGTGGFMLLYGLYFALRGNVTLVLFVQDDETLFATVLRSSRAQGLSEDDYYELGYSAALPVDEITHLWQATSSVNFVPMSDTLKVAVGPKHEVLADLLMSMTRVTDHDIARLGTFLQRYQPHLVLSYPWPE